LCGTLTRICFALWQQFCLGLSASRSNPFGIASKVICSAAVGVIFSPAAFTVLEELFNRQNQSPRKDVTSIPVPSCASLLRFERVQAGGQKVTKII
jgi:hypothetical protein